MASARAGGGAPAAEDGDGSGHRAAHAGHHGGGDDEARVARMAAAVRTLLECMGEDVGREGLEKTPVRMAKALLACTAGYAADPAAIAGGALFSCDSEEMVVVRDIDIFSMCEHHVLPFFGRAHVAYLPAGRVLGLSKLARLADVYAKRLQIQERLTTQLAAAVQDTTGARGVAVFVDCTHMCMCMRGVEKVGASTISTAYTGAFRDTPALRTEFLQLIHAAHGSAGAAHHTPAASSGRLATAAHGLMHGAATPLPPAAAAAGVAGVVVCPACGATCTCHTAAAAGCTSTTGSGGGSSGGGGVDNSSGSS